MKLASMEGKISKCFINLLLCLLATLPLAAQQNYYNQGKDTRPVATKKEKKKPGAADAGEGCTSGDGPNV